MALSDDLETLEPDDTVVWMPRHKHVVGKSVGKVMYVEGDSVRVQCGHDESPHRSRYTIKKERIVQVHKGLEEFYRHNKY
jgi:hypothetical protein